MVNSRSTQERCETQSQASKQNPENTQQAMTDFGWDNAERFHRGSGPLSWLLKEKSENGK